MKHRALIVATVATVASTMLAAPMRNAEYDGVAAYYDRVFPKLVPTRSPVASKCATKLVQSMFIVEDHRTGIGKIVNVRAGLHLILNHRTAEVIQLWNHNLVKYIAASAPQSLPKLSCGEAIVRAKEYLTALELELPTNCVIRVVAFDGDYPSQWEVRWVPLFGGYEIDDFVESDIQSMVVVFHEEYGFCGYGFDINVPPPATTVVNLSREQAISRASAVAPLVMETGFYKAARADGFKITGVSAVRICVAVPNWLLDPERAVWIRQAAPVEESRLCWIVTFATVDTVDRGDMILSRVKVLVYIDAATGEVVGANFS